MRYHVAAAVLMVSLAAGLCACDSGSPVAAPAAPCGLNLFLSDTPPELPGATAINLRFGSITLHRTGVESRNDHGIELSGGPIGTPGGLTLNLLDLRNGRLTFLGSQTLPAGSYNRVRLQVVGAEIVRGGSRIPVTVPSGTVDVPVLFDLKPGHTLALTIDFDSKSAVRAGPANAYLMLPVINVAEMKSS